MKLNKMIRFTSLLLALGLLLGLAVTGCSEKDRDKNSDTPVVTDKAFTFVFQVGEPNNEVVSVESDATDVKVIAYDGEYNVIDVKLAATNTDTAAIDDLYFDEETNEYKAHTVVDDDAIYVGYIFYYVTEGGSKVATNIYSVEMADVKTGDEVTAANDVYSFVSSDILVNGVHADSVAPGDEFVATVSLDGDNVDPLIDIRSTDTSVISKATGTTDGKHHFKVADDAAAGTYALAVEYQGIWVYGIPVTVAE